MGQKNHPLVLRIQSSTRSFDNSWYSDHFFTKLVSIDLSISQYLNTFLKTLKLPLARFSVQHGPKMTKLYTFFCYPRHSREIRSRMFQIPSGFPTLQKINKKQTAYSTKKPNSLFKNSIKDINLWKQLTPTNPIPSKFLLYKKWMMSIYTKDWIDKLSLQISSRILKRGLQQKKNSSKIIVNQSIRPNIMFSESLLNFYKISKDLKSIAVNLRMNADSNFSHRYSKGIDLLKPHYEDHTRNLNSEKGVLKKTQISSIFGDLISINTKIKKNENSFNGALPDRNVNGILINYKTHVQNSISQHFGFNAKLVPFKVENEWQDAGYFADEIVYLLERRIGFNRLKNRILTQVATNPKIQGIRITCSGRVGGKSKKAQRAKMDSIKYGQTSLHVFSSKIDFAVRTAFTPLGSTGVKVWICYD